MLTGKNILVGQSGGPTAVINASLAGVVSAGRALGAKVYGMRYGVQGLLEAVICGILGGVVSKSVDAFLKRK